MPKTAVHLHLYYVNQLDDFLIRLRNLSGIDYDLYVTTIDNNPEVKRKVTDFKNNAEVWCVPNYGYDVGPFIDFLHHIDLEKYDYVLKLHTKSNSNRTVKFDNIYINMNTWREMMLDAVLSEKGCQKALSLFMNNPKVGMVGSSHIITNNKVNYISLKSDIVTEMKKIGLKEPDDKTFVAGTMFWIRAKLLKPFLKYSINDFTETDGNVHDYTKAHVLERGLCWSVSAQGYTIVGIKFKTFKWQRIRALFKFYTLKMLDFFYEKKITHRGYLSVKILKIPVIHRKVKK